MEHLIFSIYDEKAKAYLPPFTLPASAMAVRTFTDCINSRDHAFSRHPGDYTLYELGVYDDNTAEITPHAVRLNHGIGTAYKDLNPTLKYEGPNDALPQPISNDAPILASPGSGNSA